MKKKLTPAQAKFTAFIRGENPDICEMQDHYHMETEDGERHRVITLGDKKAWQMVRRIEEAGHPLISTVCKGGVRVFGKSGQYDKTKCQFFATQHSIKWGV